MPRKVGYYYYYVVRRKSGVSLPGNAARCECESSPGLATPAESSTGCGARFCNKLGQHGRSFYLTQWGSITSQPFLSSLLGARHTLCNDHSAKPPVSRLSSQAAPRQPRNLAGTEERESERRQAFNGAYYYCIPLLFCLGVYMCSSGLHII